MMLKGQTTFETICSILNSTLITCGGKIFNIKKLKKILLNNPFY